MGCVASRPSNYQAQRRPRPNIEFYDDDSIPEVPASPPPLEEIIRVDVTKIAQGLNQIKAPQGMSPVVCLSEYAYPLYIASFLFNEQNDASIPLPVVAFYHKGRSKAMYFGTINFLMHSIIQNTETAAFLENSITWASDYKISTIKIYLYNIPRFITSTLITDIQGYGYAVEAGDEAPTGNFDIIFATTQNKEPQKLVELSQKGCSIFYFFMEPYTPSFPEMSFFGLAFPQCNLQSQSKTMKNTKVEKLQSFTIKKLIEEYSRVLNKIEDDNDDDEQTELDNVVSKLRYYISEMQWSTNQEEILAIQEMSVSYLQKTNFIDNEMICNDMKQCIVAIILTELVPKIAPASMTPALTRGIFPGIAEEDELSGCMKFDLKPGCWYSTGLWLQPGKVGIIKSTSRVLVQVGCHALCLLLKSGPWHRWPSVITSFVVEGNTEVEIGTQFGGPVFLISDRDKQVSVSLDGLCRYPCYSEREHGLWDATKDSSIQWGEIQSKYVDFNLRKSDILTLVDIKEYCEAIDATVKLIYDFEGIPEGFRSRVVFDVDLPEDEEPAIEDVVFMHINAIQDCLNPYRLTDNYAMMLISIAQSLIIDVFLDPTVERSFAICAVRYALENTMPGIMLPNCLTVEAPKLFDPLWKVFKKHGSKPFGIALKQLAKSNVEDEETAWQKFIIIISAAAETDLRKDLDHGTKPGSLSITSSERLQQFQIDDINL